MISKQNLKTYIITSDKFQYFAINVIDLSSDMTINQVWLEIIKRLSDYIAIIKCENINFYIKNQLLVNLINIEICAKYIIAIVIKLLDCHAQKIKKYLSMWQSL